MEVHIIPDIQERNDQPKSRNAKPPGTAAMQRQMVRNFLKKVENTAQQTDGAHAEEENHATEQAENTVREIVHSAVRLPHSHSDGTATHGKPEHFGQAEPPHRSSDYVRQRPHSDLHTQQESAAIIPSTPQAAGRNTFARQKAKKEATTAEESLPEIRTTEHASPKSNLPFHKGTSDLIRTTIKAPDV